MTRVPNDTGMPSWESLRRQFFALTRTERRIAPRRTAAQLVATLLLGISEGVSLVLLIPVIGALDPTGSVDTSDLSVVGGLGLGRVSLEAALGVLVVVVAIRALLARWSNVVGTELRLEVVDRLRADCLDAVLRARWEFVLGQRRSDIVETITVSANRVGVAVDQGFQLVTGIVITVATTVVALLISTFVSAVALVASIIAALVLLPVVRSARRLGREFGRRSKVVLATTTDALDALRLVRAHDAVDPWEAAFAESFRELRTTQIAHQRKSANADAVVSIAMVAGTAAFVLFGANADIPTADLVVLILVLTRMANRVLGIARIVPTLAVSLGALADIEDLRAAAVANREAPHTPDATRCTLPDPATPIVSLTGVDYRYPDGTRALSGASLEVQAGTVTVLVGPSGAGKSTIVDLVLGLLTPTAGEIRVCGRVLTPDVLPHWRAGLGYVPQDTALLPGTLRENLAWSHGGTVTDDECWAALDAAAATFARELPDGLDTLLGDRGVRLSGGERQRVALARALVRAPDLLVLDEATSALDYDTEAAVLRTVRDLCPRTTVLLVTHRISAIAPTDVVVEISAPGT